MAEQMDIDRPAGVSFDSAAQVQNTPASFRGPVYESMMAIEEISRGDDADRESDISDVDSDYLELHAETAKLDASIEAFRAEQRMGNVGGEDAASGTLDPVTGAMLVAGGSGGRAANKAPRRGTRRGPRKPAKPSPDILYRLSLATDAYHARRYREAHEMLAEIIRINAETFDAWTLLSTVFEEQGDRHAALMCLVAAAHLTPKVGRMWISAAAYALDGVNDLEDGSPERHDLLQTAMQCYSAAVRANPADVVARTSKADVLMSLGHAGLAASQYRRALKHRPLNIRTARNLADAALDVRDPRQNSGAAMEAYRRIIDHCRTAGAGAAVEEGVFEWSDLRIYLEFFAVLERWEDAARELQEVARWLLGRADDTCWEDWSLDDREWDLNDDRRISVPGYEPARFPHETYGMGLPVDLRARLCLYRLKLGQEHEAMVHLELLDPSDRLPQIVPALERFRYFPDCLKEVGAALVEKERAEEAMGCFELYRRIAAENEDVLVDGELLLHQGRCFLAMDDKAAAEECFIAAIEEDDDNIEARFELAKIYEGEQEKEGHEEAFLLVNEALRLEAQHGEEGGEPSTATATATAAAAAAAAAAARGISGKQRALAPPGRKRRAAALLKSREERRRYRPRRLGGSEERRKYEQERTTVLGEKYKMCLELKREHTDAADAADQHQTLQEWMGLARELIDDFRSSKDFYPWDKYVKSRGFVAVFPGQPVPPHSNAQLVAMAARLQQNLAPVDGQDPAPASLVIRHEHRGVPFDEWLDLFLEYALNLALAGQAQEAYEICASAGDSIVFKSKENAFLIHIAHAACAVISGDEEQCVSVARYFMREHMRCSDSYRIMAALCRICRAPVSWYSSGPAQKFILRQIRHMDSRQLEAKKNSGLPGGDDAGDGSESSDLDVCLLTIYGHIMFTTTSYTYALTYFMRAASIDPTNPMINLSLSIGYIHYALKRQATNRQYLLAQGFAFLFKYYNDRSQSASPAERQEAHFNVGRAYHIVGLSPLAIDYYRRVLDEEKEKVEDEKAENEDERVASSRRAGPEDLVLEAAYNIKTICFHMGDLEGAKAITDEWLVL